MAGIMDLELLLKDKQLFLETAAALSLEENKLIKSKVFENIGAVDAKKNSAIYSMIAADRELALAAKQNPAMTENARQIIKNINSSLFELIKLEKENELLISQAGQSISGKYIDSYKTYKHLK